MRMNISTLNSIWRVIPANTGHSPNAVSMLGQRRRRWALGIIFCQKNHVSMWLYSQYEAVNEVKIASVSCRVALCGEAFEQISSVLDAWSAVQNSRKYIFWENSYLELAITRHVWFAEEAWWVKWWGCHSEQSLFNEISAITSVICLSKEKAECKTIIVIQEE